MPVWRTGRLAYRCTGDSFTDKHLALRFLIQNQKKYQKLFCSLLTKQKNSFSGAGGWFSFVGGFCLLVGSAIQPRPENNTASLVARKKAERKHTGEGFSSYRSFLRPLQFWKHTAINWTWNISPLIESSFSVPHALIGLLNDDVLGSLINGKRQGFQLERRRSPSPAS